MHKIRLSSWKTIDFRGFFEFFQLSLIAAWKASPFYTMVRILSEIFQPFMSLAAVFCGKKVLDILSGSEVNDNLYTALFVQLLILATLTLANIFISKIVQYCQTTLEDMIQNEVSVKLMSKALEIDLEYFDNPEYYDKISAATRDSRVVVDILWRVLSCIGAITTLCASLVTICMESYIYGICMIVAAVPSSVIGARYTKRMYQLSLSQINERRKMDYCQSLSIDRNYAQSLRLYNAGPMLKEKYRRIWKSLFAERRKLIKKHVLLTGFWECLPELVSTVVGANIAFQCLAGQASIGDYSLYMGLLSQLWMAIGALSSSIMIIYDNRLRFDNIRSLEKFKNHVVDKGSLNLPHVESIEFENVTFSYPGTAEPVLKNVSFSVKKKEKVALVGLNGAGKTTLLKLLLRMYEPDGGHIRINGEDIKHYKLDELRSNFSVYFQNMPNYCFTLKENFLIADGAGHQDTEGMSLALKKACCKDIMDKASKGWETSITRMFDSDGIELSGGQAQKLAVARTFYRNHSVLVLDEPSSSMDPMAENEIFCSMEEMMSDVITLFTSHRLSNVTIADKIIVLENGTIIEQGTLEELLDSPKRFAQLFHYQQDRYAVNR